MNTHPPIPPISVVTPSLNQGAYIERTMASVLAQKVDGIEYVVVDGCSSDNSISVIRRLAESNPDIMRFTSEPDAGHSDAVNKGIRSTQAPIVGWLNSDDIYYPGALAGVLAFFAKEPAVDVVYGNADFIDGQDVVLAPYPVEAWNKQRLVEACIICQPAAFVRRSALERYGLLDLAYRSNDYELWVRLALGGAHFAHFPQRLAATRIHARCATVTMPVRCHSDINDFMVKHLGTVPAQWLSYYARAVARAWYPSGTPRASYLRIKATTLLHASHKWNGSIPAALLCKAGYWMALSTGTRMGLHLPLTPEERTAFPYERATSNQPLHRNPETRKSGRWSSGQPAAASLNIAFPYIVSRSGSDVLFAQLARELSQHGTCAELLRLSRRHELMSSLSHEERARLSRVNLIHAAVEHGSMVHTPGCPLILTALHNVMAPGYRRYTGLLQKLFHRFVVHPRQARSLQLASAIICISEATKRSYVMTYPGCEHKMRVVYPGVDLTRFTPLQKSEINDRRSGVEFQTSGDISSHRLLFVGHLTRRKGADLLPAIMDRLGPGHELTCVGQRNTRRLDSTTPSGARIRILPQVNSDEIVALYRNCSLLLFPSRLEGFGYAVAEAMACGKPVVATNGSSIPELIADGKGGILCPVDDVDAFAAAVRRVLADTQAAAQMGVYNRARAERLFSLERMAEEHFALYHEVTGGWKTAGGEGVLAA